MPVGTPAPATVGAVIMIEAVSKDYGDLEALHEVSLQLETGSTVALVGPNGAGKSTLLRIVAGLLEVTSGHVLVDGHEPGSMQARAATSFLPDNPVLYDDLSVLEHLEYISRLHGVDAWEARATELLDRLGLAHRAEDLPSTFSRGLRQKASIAIGLIRPFTALLVDEPFVGLDALGRDAMLELLAESAADGATVVVSTHELTFVERATRCVALQDGEVSGDGPLDAATVRALLT